MKCHHSQYLNVSAFNGAGLKGNYIIIDDFVNTGQTCRAIMADMAPAWGFFTNWNEEVRISGVKIFAVKK